MVVSGGVNFTLFGIDRIEAGIQVTDYDSHAQHLAKQLDQLTKEVRETRKPTYVELGWRKFEVLPGPGRLRWYDFHLVHSQMHLWFCARERANVPPVRVAVLSETLWALGPELAWREVLRLLAAIALPYAGSTLSRIDVCADFDRPLSHKDLTDIVCRGRYVGPYDPMASDADTAFDARIWMQRRRGELPLTGLQLGRSQLICRLYNKQLEIVQASGKRWMYPLWANAGWPGFHRDVDPDTGEVSYKRPVTEPWRCEFEVHREVLKAIAEEPDAPRLNSVEDGLRLAPRLWRYLTQGWLRFVDKASASPKHPGDYRTRKWWGELQEPQALPSGDPAVRLGNLVTAKLDVSARGALGYLANVAALTGKLEIRGAMEQLLKWAEKNGELFDWHEKAHTRRLHLGPGKSLEAVGD